MSSLATCIKKAGKALSVTDAAAIREIRDELVSGGITSSEANTQAIDEYLETLATERTDLIGQIEKAGGQVETPAAVTSSSYSTGDLFGQDTAAAQALADETAARDLKRSTGQEDLETGDAGDLFSEARQQKDLRFSIEDDFTEKLVDKHPTTPIAQMNKWGAVVEHVSEQAASVSSVRKFLSSLNDAGLRAYLNALPQSKLPDVIRDAMHGISDYVGEIKLMDAFISENLEKLAETGNTWRDMIRKNSKDAKLLGEIINQSTLMRVDPTIPFVMPKTFSTMMKKQKRIWIKRKIDHGIIKESWDKLSSEAQELYQTVREDYKNIGIKTLEEIEGRIQVTEADEMIRAQLIATLRKQFEAGKIDPYFHLGRFGKHWGTAIDRETGEVIAFIKRENTAERNEWVKEMRKLGYNAFPSEEKSTVVQNIKRMDPNFVAKVTEMTKKMGPEGTKIADEIWQMYLRSMPEMSAQKAYIHRVGRLGFTGDALRAYGHHMFHGTHQLGKLKHGFQLQGFLDNIDQQASELTSRATTIKESLRNDGVQKTHEILMVRFDQYKKFFNSFKQGTEEERIDKAIKKFIGQAEFDAPKARLLADEMEQRHNYNMNPTSSLLSTQLTKFGFFWFLSTSPAAGVLNLSQTAIVGLPTLGARFAKEFGAASLPKAAGQLLKASTQLASTRGDFKNTLRNDPGQDHIDKDKRVGERKALEEFELQGGTSKTRVRDLTGYAERGQNFTGRGQRLEDIATWIFHHTEKWNREITFVASYRMSREAGRKHDAAVYESAELVELSHFDYTNTNRPRFMQKDAARVVLLFRNFSLNMTYRLYRDFRDGYMRNQYVDIEVRNEAALRLTGILGGAFMFAGLSGQPLAWAFHSIADAMLGDDDEPYDSEAAMRAYFTELYGEDIATFITKGAWDTFTQTTLSTRASLNNLWIREMPKNVSGKELVQHVAVEALGPLAGIVANAVEGISVWNEGYAERGMEKMMPKFAADAMKTIRYATEGALNYDRDIIMSAEEFTNWNLASQFLGTVPTPLTTRYEQTRAVRDYQSALEKRKKYLMDRLFQAAKVGDKKEVKETYALLVKFSQKNPGMAIDTSSITRSAKIRADYDARAVFGTTVPRKQHLLHEKFRMTDKDEEE